MPAMVGGTFAPPLNDKKLAEYKSLVAAQPDGDVKEGLEYVLACVLKWWELPDSISPPIPHPTGRGQIIELDENNLRTLWESIPWKSEIAVLSRIFDTISAKPLRDAAFHLLWFAAELECGREPITTDKL